MSEENSGIQVSEGEGVVLVRVEGRGTHLNSHLLKQCFQLCLEEQRRSFGLDLSHCTYMDSTFLGVLAGLGARVKAGSRSPIQLLNPTERARGMLENLGIDHLFEVIHSDPPSVLFTDVKGNSLSKDAKSHEMLEAHEKLVELSQGNAERFHDVVALLRKKVGKPETPSGA